LQYDVIIPVLRFSFAHGWCINGFVLCFIFVKKAKAERVSRFGFL